MSEAEARILTGSILISESDLFNGFYDYVYKEKLIDRIRECFLALNDYGWDNAKIATAIVSECDKTLIGIDTEGTDVYMPEGSSTVPPWTRESVKSIKGKYVSMAASDD